CVVADRYRDRPEELARQNALNNYERYLVRTSTVQEGERVWTDAFEAPAPYERKLLLPPPPDAERVRAVAAGAKRTDGVLEMDYFYLPSGIKEPEDERAWFARTILCVDHLGGAILHFALVRDQELPGAFSEAFLTVS